MLVCQRCGQSIENSYTVKGVVYGSTCYKIVLRELGYPKGYQPDDYVAENILGAVEALKAKGSKYERFQNARQFVSGKAANAIAWVISGRYNPHHKYNQHVKEILRSAIPVVMEVE
jgi:hypothetical protein